MLSIPLEIPAPPSTRLVVIQNELCSFSFARLLPCLAVMSFSFIFRLKFCWFFNSDKFIQRNSIIKSTCESTRISNFVTFFLALKISFFRYLWLRIVLVIFLFCHFSWLFTKNAIYFRANDALNSRRNELHVSTKVRKKRWLTAWILFQ